MNTDDTGGLTAEHAEALFSSPTMASSPVWMNTANAAKT
jgi:hypothetical protein